MKILVVLLVAVCCVQCRKTYQPLDKNANLDFINMEGGGGTRPGPSKPSNPPAKPVVVPPIPKPAAPAHSAPAPATPKPVAPVTPKPAVVVTPPIPTPARPAQSPSQIKPVPVNPKPVANPISTPGPGTVKQLVNFYDSQGKASPIRPYSYSQAVKQG